MSLGLASQNSDRPWRQPWANPQRRRVLEVYAMQVLECDAKKLLSRHAIASPPGIVAATPEEAEAAATQLGREPVFVKAQVGAGDRMSAGGIRAAHSAAEAKFAA
jgi:succinyl-CoA synthetase beta subunit